MYIGPIISTHAKYVAIMPIVGKGVSMNAKDFARGSESTIEN